MAVKEAWKTIDKAMCKRIMLRVRRNMKNVKRLRGGNFYREGSK